MSTRESTYVIWGVKLPYMKTAPGADPDDFEAQDAWLDKLEPFDARKEGSGPGRVIALSDGMGGKYLIVGYCLAQSRDYGGFDGGPVTIPMLAMMAQKGDVLSEFAKRKNEITVALKELGLEIAALGQEINWMVVTHYR